jgi:hypothetical protein
MIGEGSLQGCALSIGDQLSRWQLRLLPTVVPAASLQLHQIAVAKNLNFEAWAMNLGSFMCGRRLTAWDLVPILRTLTYVRLY